MSDNYEVGQTVSFTAPNGQGSGVAKILEPLDDGNDYYVELIEGSIWGYNTTGAEVYIDETWITTPPVVLWEIRVDNSTTTHFCKGAEEVDIFVRGVRAIKPDALLERRVWEKF